MDFDRHTAGAVIGAAELALEKWARRLGDSGAAAMRSRPGLLASVDQHVVQIRSAVVDRLGRLHPVALAAYADGVADTATAKGWSPEETAAGWHNASWPSVHLLAVCVLAGRV
jgi:Family of unknown function (DUF6401)